MKVDFVFAWFDFFIGLYYNKKKKWLYILPLPMCAIVLKFGKSRPSDFAIHAAMLYKECLKNDPAITPEEFVDSLDELTARFRKDQQIADMWEAKGSDWDISMANELEKRINT